MSGATSYDLQRGTDGVTYVTIASPTVPYYTDTTVTTGTQYFYQVASVGSGGTSPYAGGILYPVVPTPNGELSLGELRLRCQQRADRVNSQFLTTPEWNSNINDSLRELYDLLTTSFEDYFLAEPAKFYSDGTTSRYPLPDGITTFTNTSGASFVAVPFYKLMGVDLGLNSANNANVTMNKFNFIDRNRYIYPNSAGTIYGTFNMRYRVMGDKITFTPTPSANQPITLWCMPRLATLLADTDITTIGVSGWLEYVIIDAAIKALQKEESDISVLAIQKAAIIKRIEETAANRDIGQPDTISNTRSPYGGDSNGFGPGFNGPSGGF